MAGTTAAEESSAIKPSGIVFERNELGAAGDDANPRLGAERRQF
jgi:hypothetical protein